MNAALLELPIETPKTLVSCANCPAVQRLERALEQLRADFRREVGYWKSQHAKAVKRIEQLKEELDQSRGQVHALQDKLFGRKSDRSASPAAARQTPPRRADGNSRVDRVPHGPAARHASSQQP